MRGTLMPRSPLAAFASPNATAVYESLAREVHFAASLASTFPITLTNASARLEGMHDGVTYRALSPPVIEEGAYRAALTISPNEERIPRTEETMPRANLRFREWREGARDRCNSPHLRMPFRGASASLLSSLLSLQNDRGSMISIRARKAVSDDSPPTLGR